MGPFQLLPLVVALLVGAPESDAATVGDGPLLTAVRTEDRTRIFVVVEPGRPARELLRFGHNLSVRARLDRRHALIDFHARGDGLRVVDLETGKTRRLIEGAVREEFLGLEKGVVFVLTDGRLLAIDVAALDAKPRRLTPRTVGHVIATSANHFWAITTDETPALVRIAKHPAKEGSQTHRVTTEIALWKNGLSTCEISPDETRVALGVARKDDLFATRDLVILDAATGAVVRELKKIPVGVSMLSSQMPRLEMTWIDEARIRFSETTAPVGEDHARGFTEGGRLMWVDLDVKSGKRLRVTDYGPVELRHHKPPAGEVPDVPKVQKRWQVGSFDRTRDAIHFTGDEAPIADATNRDSRLTWGRVKVSLNGRFAAIVTSRPKVELVIADSTTRKSAKAAGGYFWNLAWLPAVSK